jgi:PEP-CTERM motif
VDRSRAGLLAACLIALCLAPAAVSADPILVTITGGAVDAQPFASTIDVVGTEGFSLTSRLGQVLSGFGQILPGETNRVGVTPVGTDFFDGTVTLRGVTYQDIGGESPNAPGLSLRVFSDQFVMPAFTGDPLSLRVPFSITKGVFDAPGVDAMMNGQGTATIDLLPTSAGLWLIDHARFNFASAVAPTPEPASVLLIGTALAGLVAAGRRRQ